MFGIGTPELILIVVLLALILGPRNLPKAARKAGKSRSRRGSPVRGPMRTPVCMSRPSFRVSSTALAMLRLTSTVPERSFPWRVFSRQPTGA